MSTPHAAEQQFVLTITCPDTMGVVAAVSGFLFENEAFITESAHYSDPYTGMFFLRTVFRAGGPRFPAIDKLKAGFALIGDRFDMTWAFHDARKPPRVAILVSRFGHCLNDLLHDWRTGQLLIDIPAVISNHEDMRSLVEWHGIPYHHLPVTKASKATQEAELLSMLDDMDVDLVVLARYMQILSADASARLAGRCINIHHSFLPGFKGATPYQQAHRRGVKLIGATAHYVTADLDEGPIIEQAVDRVDHTYTVDDLVRTGRHIESTVLSRAVRWHVERRVMLNGTKTVVFR
ncbi:formyltetrahydrofolate deformylase [Novispirillum sp. DQ9]|uniref:formyltetrahydrofolate deformylase n=1 Tax=Novispirillum sp. DQ9 TaxID=3398612 RepID=UPI003C7C6031